MRDRLEIRLEQLFSRVPDDVQQGVVCVQPAAVGSDEGDTDRSVVEGHRETQLAHVSAAGCGLILPTRILVHSPVRDARDAHDGDAENVNRGPAPRVCDPAALRVDHADRPVVEHDVCERSRVGEPVFVQEQDAQHNEEVEMGLVSAAGEVDDRDRRGQQSKGDDRAENATVARLAPGQGRARGQNRDHTPRQETVSKSGTGHDGEERDRGHVHPEQEQDRSVSAQPDAVRQQLPVRKPTLDLT